MQIHIIAIGERMPAWVDTAYREYAKRLGHDCRLRLHEIPAGKRPRGADIARIVRREGERALQAIPEDSEVVALERTGRLFSTEELADKLRTLMAQGRDLVFLIGGPEGLATACLERAHATWSLSPLTLAHPVARVVLAEQLYRAWSILKYLPYHR